MDGSDGRTRSARRSSARPPSTPARSSWARTMDTSMPSDDRNRRLTSWPNEHLVRLLPIACLVCVSKPRCISGGILAYSLLVLWERAHVHKRVHDVGFVPV